MRCTQCGLWELAEGDFVCGWCGTSYLSYAVTLHPPEISPEDYPPPLELQVHNQSPLGTLIVERIQAASSWIALLPDQSLPRALAAGTSQRFLLDVDTFTAGSETEAAISVSAAFAAEPQPATLHLRHPGPRSA